jgi:aryl-alcohol dehydrogenase-like predicted oxidoreductase
MAVAAIETTDAAAAGTVGLGGDTQVRRLGYGAMRITGDGIWGPPKDHDAAIAVLRRAVELGVNFIDTADSYGPEVSEELIAEALHPYPGGLVIATKGGLTRSGPSQWERDGHPEHLREACEGSLRRLKVERIDVYQLHAVDSEVPLEESVGTLAELRDEGKVGHVGLSNVDTDQLARAREIVPIVSVQNRYSIGDRVAEPALEGCERDGIAFIPWFPLGSGGLATQGPISRIAQAHDASPFQVALAWLLARSPVMLPIPGTSSVDHVEENVAAASLRLTEAEFAELSALGE